MWLLIIAFYLGTVILPIIWWLGFFLWQDRIEPEPRRLLIKTFLWGIGAAFLARAVEITLFSIIFSFKGQGVLPEDISFLGNGNIWFLAVPLFFLGGPIKGIMAGLAGPIEEGFKYLVLKETVYRKTAFNQIADGVIYGITLTLGFVLVENTLYFLELLGKSSNLEFVGAAIIRGILTILLHVVCAGIIGLFLGKAKFAVKGKRIIIFKGLIAAILIHTFYNLVFFVSSFAIILNCALVLIAFGYLLNQLRKPESRMIWKLIIPKNQGPIA